MDDVAIKTMLQFAGALYIGNIHRNYQVPHYSYRLSIDYSEMSLKSYVIIEDQSQVLQIAAYSNGYDAHSINLLEAFSLQPLWNHIAFIFPVTTRRPSASI